MYINLYNNQGNERFLGKENGISNLDWGDWSQSVNDWADGDNVTFDATDTTLTDPT